jgi:hypothetical protein
MPPFGWLRQKRKNRNADSGSLSGRAEKWWEKTKAELITGMGLFPPHLYAMHLPLRLPPSMGGFRGGTIITPMQQLTPQGHNLIGDLARRYNLSYDSAIRMLVAVNQGGGTMAQFSCPELGSGQWMRGGMTMVSDMFNHSLKNTVNNLCGELSNILANHQVFQPLPPGAGGNHWWPGDLGSPSSSGSQNNIRYAFFPAARRLVVQRDGQVSVFDTMDHQIGGVSQQQGGGSSLKFTSQYGMLSTLNLPLVSGPGLQAGNPVNFAAPPVPVFQASQPPAVVSPPPQPAGDVVALLEKLGQLRDAGILTPEEFNTKKGELLQRL